MNQKEGELRRLISTGHEAPILERFAYRAVRTFTYKVTPQADLEITIHFPYDHSNEDRRAGALFFFGGGYVAGTREQFTRQCAYLSARGMVAATADYRVRNYHGTSLAQCVEDAIDASRWLRFHAGDFGIAEDKIVVGGGSAGATIAAMLGALSTTDLHGRDSSAGFRPNALAMYNPAFGIAGSDIEARLGLGDSDRDILDFEAKIGAEYPPSWLWYGADDLLYERSKPTLEHMRRECGRVELLVEEGADHGFFNDYERYFRSALASLDKFLVSLGYIS